MTRRPEFDPRRPLVAARGFRFAGKEFEKGDPFPIAGFNLRLIRQQYGARAVDHVFGDENTEAQIQMTGPSGGRYTITAPWLEKPIVVRGKVKSEEALAEITEAGPPVGWVEGGSEVQVEEGGGGWYRMTAPWLDEPEKVQGEDAARALFAKLHEAGPPEPAEPAELVAVEYPASLVILSIVDDKFHVSAPWMEATEIFDDVEAAEKCQADVRADGPPEDWFDVVAAVTLEPADGKFEVFAPWLDEAETFDTDELASARRDELIAEGPPNDWDPAAAPADAGTSDDDATASS